MTVFNPGDLVFVRRWEESGYEGVYGSMYYEGPHLIIEVHPGAPRHSTRWSTAEVYTDRGLERRYFVDLAPVNDASARASVALSRARLGGNSSV